MIRKLFDAKFERTDMQIHFRLFEVFESQNFVCVDADGNVKYIAFAAYRVALQTEKMRHFNVMQCN